ncbi:hypothetical protein H2201_007608 [Coniosporium apollinis]|uniref:Uncharacterized protein n=2 Tax=Coniosporium TaxID=2810619 RepID=A0ABQ9NLY7_9PEZI|nr:hypothetical protein H2199_006315 [Cladosporium sp. JES 115]KAJ9658827.1 hypothetical protein H2201_007608 [Coniosporium apollinis]
MSGSSIRQLELCAKVHSLEKAKNMLNNITAERILGGKEITESSFRLTSKALTEIKQGKISYDNSWQSGRFHGQQFETDPFGLIAPPAFIYYSPEHMKGTLPLARAEPTPWTEVKGAPALQSTSSCKGKQTARTEMGDPVSPTKQRTHGAFHKRGGEEGNFGQESFMEVATKDCVEEDEEALFERSADTALRYSAAKNALQSKEQPTVISGAETTEYPASSSFAHHSVTFPHFKRRHTKSLIGQAATKQYQRLTLPSSGLPILEKDVVTLGEEMEPARLIDAQGAGEQAQAEFLESSAPQVPGTCQRARDVSTGAMLSVTVSSVQKNTQPAIELSMSSAQEALVSTAVGLGQIKAVSCNAFEPLPLPGSSGRVPALPPLEESNSADRR